MDITFYGHASFLLKINETSILFDPFITGNPLAKAIDVNSIKADYVLLSHGHQDHILDALAIAKNNGATIVSNFEIVSWYGKQGYEKAQPLNHGGSWKFDFGSVKYVNAIHTSSLPDGSYVIGMHFDTFPFIELKDKEGAKKAFADAGKKLSIMEIGETVGF